MKKRRVLNKVARAILVIVITILVMPLAYASAAATTAASHSIKIKIDDQYSCITNYGWYWVKDSDYSDKTDTSNFQPGKRINMTTGPNWTQGDIAINGTVFSFSGNVRSYTPFVWIKCKEKTGYTFNGLQVKESDSSSPEDLSYVAYNGGYITDVGCYKGDWASQKKADRVFREKDATITIIPKFTANTYDVIYNGNGHTGGSTANNKATYDSNFLTTPNGYTKTGYTFNGWNQNADGSHSSNWWLNSSGVYESGKSWKWTYTYSITLYAQWKANNYTVKYNANGGSGSMSDSGATYDSNFITRQNAFTRPGYVFTGWNEKADGTGTAWNASTTGTYENGTPWKWKYTSNITLYAQWKKVDFKLTFNPNGGVLRNPGGNLYNGTNTNSVTVTLDKGNYWAMSGDIPIATGYTFKGWYTGGSNQVQVYDASGYCTNEGTYWKNKLWVYPGDVTLYAQWKAHTYTIKYEITKPSTASSNVTGTMSNSSHTYDVYRTLNENKYALTGWTFAGWNTKADGSGTSYSDKQSVRNLTTVDGGAVTLYAQWKANTYNIVYNSNKPSKASNSVVGSTATSSHTYDVAKNLTLNGYSIVGWVFTGWNTKADGSGTSYSNGQSVINLTANDKGTVNLYAQWRPITYTIQYIGNGNTSGATASSVHTYDVAKNLTPNGYIKNTYNFTGWNTKADGSSTKYSNKQSVINLTTKDGDVVKLYAQWEKTVKLTFNMNGGLYDKSNQSIVLTGTMYNNQTTYTFNIDGGATQAKALTYSAQSGTITPYGAVTVNGINSLLTKKSTDGTIYRFLGWSTNSNSKEPTETLNVYNNQHAVSYTISNSTTLYAIWEPVLIAQVKTDRVLGTLDDSLESPTATVMASYTTNVNGINGSTVTLANPGEAIKYTVQHRGKLESLQVKFDSYISNMYDMKNPMYTDYLNVVNMENINEVIPSEGYTEVNSSLNRLILNPEQRLTRMYLLPLYLGSERAKEASHQATKYYVDYIFTNSSSFYYKYTTNKPEVITIRQIIMLPTQDEDDQVNSTLEQLRTKLKIRFR